MSENYYSTKLEFTYSNSRAFNTAIYSMTPKSHIVRIKSIIMHSRDKLSSKNFENAKVKIIVHNSPSFVCKFAKKDAILLSETLICANTLPSTFNIYYEQNDIEKTVTVVLYLPGFSISHCHFTKA